MRRRGDFELVDIILRLVGVVVALFVFSALSLYLTDRAKFWRIVITIVVVIVIGVLAIIGTVVYLNHRKRAAEAKSIEKRASHFNELIKTTKRLNLVDSIYRFIDLHGASKTRDSAWSYRDKNFSYHDLEDLTSLLKMGGVPLDDVADLREILQHYIQRRGQESIANNILDKTGVAADSSAINFQIIQKNESLIVPADTEQDAAFSKASRAKKILDDSLRNKLFWNIAIPIIVAVVAGIILRYI